MRRLEGTIVSKRMAKTVVVRVDRLRRHPKYHKSFRISQKYKAHVDDTAPYEVGDRVRITETRPLSREKRWRVAELVRSMPREAAEAESEAL